MSEIASLIERAMKYLRSAELLMREGDNESSVSRAYYAMHYAAQAVLLTKGLSSSSHKGLISLFGEHFVKEGVFSRDMSKELGRAFEKRQLGDYEYVPVITSAEAQEILDKGHEFVETIVGYLKQSGFLQEAAGG